jgi:hypothetical protein
MALPSSGTITMAQINAEFGRGNNLNAYRGTTYYTSSGGPFTFSSGALSFSNFYGTTATSPSFSFSISQHIDRANLRSLAVAAGWNQSSPVTATLTGGYYLYSTTTQAALTIDGSWPGGVTFVNNGYVMGLGGNGGGIQFIATNNIVQNVGLSAGANAINLGVSCTIQNNSIIGGGGGGGGSNTTGVTPNQTQGYCGGGGAGGGNGGYWISASGVTSPGGAGGGIGSPGGDGISSGSFTGGGGGRIMPGSNRVSTATSGTPASTATSTGGGGGNAGSATTSGSSTSGSSFSTFGLGGSAGGTGTVSAGFAYGSFCTAAGGGGGWGASGSSSSVSSGPGVTAPGAAGGKCVNLNGYSLTWSATGTRYGAIS